MSVRATNFIRGLRGLTPVEKAVAFVIADHCNFKTGICSASMSTVAIESGLAARQVASRIVQRLTAFGVLTTRGVSKGRTTTAYQINFSYNRNSLVAVDSPATATPELRLQNSNRNPGASQPQPWSTPTATPGLHEGFEGNEGVAVEVESSEGAFGKTDDDDFPETQNFKPKINPKIARLKRQAQKILVIEFPQETCETIAATLDVILHRAKSIPRTSAFLVESFRNELADCVAKGGKLHSWVQIAQLHRGVEERASRRAGR